MVLKNFCFYILYFIISDGIIPMEHGATARFENNDDDIAPVSIAHGENLYGSIW